MPYNSKSVRTRTCLRSWNPMALLGRAAPRFIFANETMAHPQGKPAARVGQSLMDFRGPAAGMVKEDEVGGLDKEALRRILEKPPQLHSGADFGHGSKEDLVSWGIQASFLQYMSEVVHPGNVTLETGSGLSTICFAILEAEHTCVTPAEQEFDRIRTYCHEHGVSTERLRFVALPSQVYLPRIDLGGRELDFALIDGSHAFPTPLIDYYYINENLKIGGLLAIDDGYIPSVGILHAFLKSEPAYELVRIDSVKTIVYRKIAKTFYPNDWPDQRFNKRFPDFSFLPIPQRIWAWTVSRRAVQWAYRVVLRRRDKD